MSEKTSKARACDPSVQKVLVRSSFVTSSQLQQRKVVVSSCVEAVPVGVGVHSLLLTLL